MISRMAIRSHSPGEALERAGDVRSGPGRRRCRGRPCSGGRSRTGTADAGRPRPAARRGWLAGGAALTRDFFHAGRAYAGSRRLLSRACTVEREPERSVHHSCDSTSTIAMPRPASADEGACMLRGRVPLPPSVTETCTPSSSRVQDTRMLAVGQRLGVAHGVRDELGDDHAGVLDGLAGRRRCRPSRTSAGAGRPRPTTDVKGRRIVIGARTELLATAVLTLGLDICGRLE